MREGWVVEVLSGNDVAALRAEAARELATVDRHVIAACARAVGNILATTRPERPLTVDHQRALDGAIGRTTERVALLAPHVAALRAKVWSQPQLARMQAWLQDLSL